MRLTVGAAMARHYASIFVMPPSPEILRFFFIFRFVDSDALQHADCKNIQSTNPARGDVVPVSKFSAAIRFITPNDAPLYLSQAELLVVIGAANLASYARSMCGVNVQHHHRLQGNQAQPFAEVFGSAILRWPGAIHKTQGGRGVLAARDDVVRLVVLQELSK